MRSLFRTNFAASVIRVAIVVCGPETTALADSLETLLGEAKGFKFSRLEYRAKTGIKPHAAGFGNPEVVVAMLGAFQATNMELFFASLRRALQ